MPKSEDSTNMQSWFNVFQPGTGSTYIYDTTNKEWKLSSSFTPGDGKIPKFEKVKTLDDFCETEGAMRKPKPTEGDKKLEVFCLLSK